MQIIPLVKILLQGTFGISPGSEVVELPSDLLGPPLRSVRKEWKVWIRFPRLGTIRRGYADTSRKVVVSAVAAARIGELPFLPKIISRCH